MAAWTIGARWVFPVTGPPLLRGTVTIDGQRIVAVDPAATRSPDLDLGNAAILPGLVNAHTHLDLTGMRGLAPPSPDFTGWLRQVIAHRGQRTPPQVRKDIREGLAECIRTGTTLIADIAAEGASWDLLTNTRIRAVVFRELIGLSRERAEEAARNAAFWAVDHNLTPTCLYGVSPHAPYSFRAELLPALLVLPGLIGAPITVHLAESPAEIELLQGRSGPFVPFLAERGAWDPTGLAWSPEHVIELTSLADRILYAHCNYLSPNASIPPQGTIVYCPRTHAAFGHAPHPFREFLARGVRVALGTDSLASNPDLDLLAEARFLRQRYPDFPGESLLRMATLSGAEALDWADETGSLEPGKSADLIVVPLPDRDVADPYDLVFDSDLSVRAVLFRGEWSHDADGELCAPV